MHYANTIETVKNLARLRSIYVSNQTSACVKSHQIVKKLKQTSEELYSFACAIWKLLFGKNSATATVDSSVVINICQWFVTTFKTEPFIDKTLSLSSFWFWFTKKVRSAVFQFHCSVWMVKIFARMSVSVNTHLKRLVDFYHPIVLLLVAQWKTVTH